MPHMEGLVRFWGSYDSIGMVNGEMRNHDALFRVVALVDSSKKVIMYFRTSRLLIFSCVLNLSLSFSARAQNATQKEEPVLSGISGGMGK